MSVSVIVRGGGSVSADSPHWDDHKKAVLYTDTRNQTVHRWNSVTKDEDALKLDEPVSYIMPSTSGGYIVGVGSKIGFLEWCNGTVAPLFDAGEDCNNMCFNEGKCDAAGRLWAGTQYCKSVPNDDTADRVGSLFCMRRSGRTIKKMDNLSVSGGVAWSNDNTVMYRSDPHSRKIYAFDFDFVYGETAMGTKRTAIDFTNNKTSESGEPRGLCSDSEGKLWVAFSNPGKVVRYDPITGERLHEVAIPNPRVTSCCFGGENLAELYVTATTDGLTNKDLANDAGSVFRVTNLGVTGEPVADCLMDGTLSP